MADLVKCPAAEPHGYQDNEGGVVCKIMERDQAQKDSILEGAPIGVWLSVKDDPKQLATFCCGVGPPTNDPDKLTNHHTACPVWAAAKEWDGIERIFAMTDDRPDEGAAALLRDQGSEEPMSTEEVEWMVQ